jgi:hypothetical protein
LTAKVISLTIPAGIQRDGTLFDSPMYVDGKWVRFQRGRPRKIGGYRGIFLNANEISRGMIMQSQNGINYVYSGSANYVQAWQVDDDDGVGSGPTNITVNNFTASAQNLWQFDVGYDSNGTGALQIVAHPGQNLLHIDNDINTPVLTGTFPGGALSAVGTFTLTGNITAANTIVISSEDFRIGIGQTVSATTYIPSGVTVSNVVVASGTTTVTTTGGSMTVHSGVSIKFDNNISVSGGAVMLYPYLFVYGDNGLIQNCAAGDFTNWVSADSNSNNVSATKIVKGMALRGGTTSPAGLFWSLDQLTRVTYAPQTVGTATLYWRYDIISGQTSILSSQSVIEYDGIYYWCGVDRFLAYNGVVQEIENNVNINFFYDNLNYSQRQKVWATKVPRWGEIWWFYPKGDATECTDAIILNVRDKTWYDAGEALGARRSAGLFSEVFRYPIWAGNTVDTSGKYTLWQHETGTDEVYLTNVNAVESYFETNSLGWVNGGPGVRAPVGDNRYIRLERIEPDFVQSGEMSVIVTGKGYADGTDEESAPYTFQPDTLKIDMREQRREMRLRFVSNTFNGNYETGCVLLSADVGDERSTGNP